MGNIVHSQTAVLPEWFVDPNNGNLHLTSLALAAIDAAMTLADVAVDIDGHARPIGSGYDYGADEYGEPGPPGPTPPPTPPPFGQPYVDWDYKYLGGGKYAVTFTVRGNDGLQKSFFVDAAFEGTDGGHVEQIQAFGTVDVDSDTDAATYDAIPEANYDMDRDSYFLEPFPSNLSPQGVTQSDNHYQIEAGTGPGSALAAAALAYLCTTGDLTYDVTISRDGVNYVDSGTLILAPPGDANYDGVVDGADYTSWADHYNQTDVGWGEADFNGDDIVDGADYTVWADFYTGGAAVPEPTVAVLLALGAAGLLRRRRE
jgi:hypothetical protein